MYVKWPIIHEQWRGKVEGFISYLGNGHVWKPIIYLQNHLAKSTWPIGKFIWTLWKSKWIPSHSVLCQVLFILLTFPLNCEFDEPVGWAPILQRHLTKHNGMWLAHKKTRLSTMNKRTIHCKVMLAFSNTCKPSHERWWKLEWCNIIKKIEHAIWFLKIFCKSLQV